MGSSESKNTPTRSNEYHDFALEYYVDDHESPTEVTITSADNSGALATEWITADIVDAIPLESIQ